MFDNLIRFRHYRYFWWGAATVVIAVGLFASQTGNEPANGGTWQGLVLGVWGALLIAWLALLGVRKRRYRSTMVSLQDWTSLHVYLGLAVLVVSTLHAGLQFGWNVHTLAYLLMLVVISSGILGLYAYLNYPRRLAENQQGQNRSQLFGELYELNEQGESFARSCGAEVQAAATSAIQRTAIGGGVISQLLARDHSRLETLDVTRLANPDQAPVIELVSKRIPRAEKIEEVAALQDLLVVLCRRQTVIQRLRADIRLQARLNAWLYVHVPLTAATLAALIVHILVTFVYW